ncbi:MAG: hypothetical protein EHM45_13380 [Desulfobacteraceae bacterium]|nr:MAG: hypothetical protein EHM45_13380 [Desulfobacteraceae bacterium]
MKDLEKILKKAPCRDVPDRVGRKVEMEFQQAEEKRRVFFSRPIPLWAHIGICFLCLYAGFAFHSLMVEKPGYSPLADKPEETQLSGLAVSSESYKLFFDEMNNRSGR